jgi:hypothetical protein
MKVPPKAVGVENINACKPGYSPGVGPREALDILRNTFKPSLANRAILTFLKAKRAFF